MPDYAELAARFKDVLGMQTSPVALYYSDERPPDALSFKGIGMGMCAVSLMYQAAKGKIAAIHKEAYGCPGAGRYLGFIEIDWPGFPYFLSSGIEGELEGERYLKTPEIAKAYLERMKVRPAPAEYCIFAPLDGLPNGAVPEVVIFFVPPDVLSALVVLADFDNPRTESNTLVRFSSG
ncbi:MAG TPA: hypothetical protein ENF73_02945, partial [Proteobacteria bacterium]|nr:hypothetical protein [Pseudomonadota bacterium]